MADKGVRFVFKFLSAGLALFICCVTEPDTGLFAIVNVLLVKQLFAFVKEVEEETGEVTGLLVVDVTETIFG